MREIELTMKEQEKYKVIKDLAEKGGNKKSAAIKLGVTERTINLLIQRYKKEGKAAFSHKNKGKKPSTTIPSNIRKQIINLYKYKYYDYNWAHYCEKLFEVHNIDISYCTLHQILSKVSFLSPLAFKKTKKALKKKLEEKENLTNIEKITYQDDLMYDLEKRHPRMPRAKYFGELIQMDASQMEIEGIGKIMLHVAVDDSKNVIVGAYFDYQETLNGYYNVFYQILNNYGIPAKFRTDNRTIFIYNTSERKDSENDAFTQFSYACHQLGVGIETTSIPQKKGRVERLNGTLIG